MSVHENETISIKQFTSKITEDVAEVHIRVILWRKIVDPGECKGLPIMSKQTGLQYLMLMAMGQELKDRCRIDEKGECPGFVNQECALCRRMLKPYADEGVCKAKTCSLGAAMKESIWISLIDTLKEAIPAEAFDKLFTEEVHE
jgi:hypothetical protein